MPVLKLDDSVAHSFLDGSRFGEDITVGYHFQRPLRNRVKVLADMAAGKRILHIGCCDHIQLLPAKMAAGTWLHGRLTGAAARCIGIDIDAEAVRHARTLSQLSNIYCGDITLDAKIDEIANEIFDFAIFGEVIEHIGDPVQFLRSFLRTYKGNIRQVIITVPNALRGGNIRNAFRARETINSDHRFFFTPYTIAKVAWDAGFTPMSMQMAHYSAAGPIKRAILNLFPLLAEDIIYVGAPRG